MSVVDSLVWMYPPAFRERWGSDAADEARQAGRRAWLNLALGVADAWLHPTVWPAGSRAQRRFRAGSMAVTIATLSWFITYLVSEVDSPSYSSGLRAPALTCTGALLCLGLVLVSPWPRLTRYALVVLARRAGRRLGPPALLAGAVIVLVDGVIGGNGLDYHQPLAVRVIGIGSWWLALTGGAIQTCRMLSGLGDDVVLAPSPGRLRPGLWALAVSAVSSAIVLLSRLPSGRGFDPTAAGGGAVLLLLTTLALTTLRDQRQLARP